ncbi:unnamed protein product [Adineta steineri]|uniref:Aminotransferase class I/classII large domain-containing protein n=1 Tax=Adineta steineri TaxID=433720 RepID=A0A815H7I0_9BILA|nr:unnamed protein product [Adineta steineri]CAF1350300.1 unnamed protein product [Adineta steineri]CAF1414562.1 unnamed protein product [Adineta steineri]CAF1618719.1 unnamed protein product [Adineta steineri]
MDTTNIQNDELILSQRILSGINSSHYQRIGVFVQNEYGKILSAHKESSSLSTLCDFTFGNPHNMALPTFLSSFHKYIEPLNVGWYGYCMATNPNTEPSRQIVALNLSKRFSPLSFQSEDIYLVKGNFGGLYTCISMLLNPNDEVIFPIPAWFCYEAMIISCQGISIEVNINLNTFDLNLDEIKNKISDRTKILIINTPHNPTGKIYSSTTLELLSNILLEEYERRQQKYGQQAQPIWLVSDEAYNNILFNNNKFYSPAEFYPYTFLCYTYAKTLLNPGIRLGYIALSEKVPLNYRLLFQKYLPQTLIVNGFQVPDCVTQYLVQDIEKLSISIDIENLEKKLNSVLDILLSIGYEIPVKPEGTFYILIKSPLEDDQAFCRLLSKYNVLCLPGAVLAIPGYFRISLTANEDMIERSREGFKQAYEEAMSSNSNQAIQSDNK